MTVADLLLDLLAKVGIVAALVVVVVLACVAIARQSRR
ncbi:hypothetical protein Psed_4609 [Pseudonocardia dioxanivorans CB1190]|uniref:Uncharacterized protein n=1 Tax=Pseudonocardia dioxanivorans (strain ATCC 55486 / DSM 44775 / JCM 13855 / CB1190) TaxID=675635 RepID=F4D0G3_PSEUX|nr:hypothetical protein Psed_4609 [Pseudonocardia dioxanivorans CB1190]